MVFLFLNIVFLVIYIVIMKSQTKMESQNVDIIFVAKGRQRAALQHSIWIQKWSPLARSQFIVLHLQNVDPQEEDTNTGLIHIHTTYQDEKELFLNVATVIPIEQRSPRFLWVSDTIIPLQSTSLEIFERTQSSDRFFGGFFPDYRLLNVEHVLEPSIPCGLTRYGKMRFSNYEHFLVDFISGRHKTFAFIAEVFVLPNRDKKPKRPLSSDLFQIAMISPREQNQHFYNEKLKQLWAQYKSQV